MKFGYIRVSRDKQMTALQADAMNHEEDEKTFTGKMTDKCFNRPEFLKMQEQAPMGDIIVVWGRDRLARSLQELIETVGYLPARDHRGWRC